MNVTRARTNEGTGIGLALVQELARLHGGEVKVESREGQGSTFYVTVKTGQTHLATNRISTRRRPAASVGVPFVEEALRWLPSAQEAGADSTVQAIPGRAPSLPRARVLLADDNVDMREYVSRILAAHFEVETVADGEAALRSIRIGPPDLVLTDVMMPRLDGFGLLREIRANDKTKTIPVIMLSARAGEEARVDGLDAGANDYLIKPFTARELLARVQSQLELERQRADSEKALRESEERFRVFVTTISDVVYRMSADWTEMRYLHGGEFIADTPAPNQSWLRKYIHPDDQKMLLAAIHAAIQSKSQFQLEHRVIRADGTLGWTFSRAIPIFNEQGEIVEWFGAATDISSRKEVEEKLEESLEREKAARTEAEAAARAKDDFLAMLSHELRTPLNPVLLIASDSVENSDLPPEVRQQFETILKNVEIEARIIDDLLDLSRIRHGKFRLSLKSVDAHAVLHDAIHAIEDQIAKKQVQPVLNLDATEHSISADPVRLHQIFWNVIKNALKFTPNGGRITIESRSTAGVFTATISDTGIGMTAEELANAFSAFAQGDHIREHGHNFGGLGLGLAITKKLVEMHSGRIHATSAGRNRGSSFTIEFPIAASTADLAKASNRVSRAFASAGMASSL